MVGVVVVGHHVAVQGKGVLRDDLHHALPADADADGRRLQHTEDRGEEGASVWGLGLQGDSSGVWADLDLCGREEVAALAEQRHGDGVRVAPRGGARGGPHDVLAEQRHGLGTREGRHVQHHLLLQPLGVALTCQHTHEAARGSGAVEGGGAAA